MQTLKDSVKFSILKIAAEEFQEKDYVHANMRTIAAKVGISTGNLYNYFPTKDAIFTELVNPVIEKINQGMKIYEDMDYLENEYKWGLDCHYKFIEIVASFIDQHRQQIRLLLFKAQGSSLENYQEEFIENYTDLMIKSISLINKTYPEAVKPVSDFFLHTVTSLYANVINEIIMHDLSYEEMLENLNELMTFMLFGWDHFFDKKKMFSPN